MNSSNLAPKIKTRTSLFYGRWPWCLRGYQTEFFCLRVLDHGRIDRIIDNRREWGRRINLRQPGSWYWSDLNITDQDIQNLHAMCDFLMEEQRPHKLVIAGSWFYLYTDDRSLIADMASLPWLDPDRIEITQVQLEGQPNTLIRRQARYRNRSYFRSLLLDEGRRQNLARVLQNQDHIRLGPSLQRWVHDPKWYRTLDYHFIDHDDSSILTLLALIEPRLIRRTLPIVPHK